jgi:hypothetical protein
MRATIQPSPTSNTRTAPRVTRSTAAVIAQYIQDLTTPATPADCPA